MKSLFLSVILILLFSACTTDEKKVMLVFSYHQEYEWVEEEIQGVVDVLGDKHVMLEKFYMDTKQHTSDEWKQEISAKAFERIEEFQPDVLMVFDDNACKYVAQNYIGTSLPVVFCGMNGYPDDYGFPTENITGVEERELWHESFNFIKELVPGVKKAVILLDNSSTAELTAKRIENSPLIKDFMDVYRIGTFDKWKESVLNIQDSTDALGLFVYFSIKDSTGNTVPPEDILDWTLKNNSLPEFAILDFTVKNGAFCGVIETGYDQGKMAAEMVEKILNGQSPADIPVITPHKGEKYINGHRAVELGIQIPDEVKEEAIIVK